MNSTKYEVFQSDRDGGWAAEHIDGEGAIYRVLFTGPDSERLAKEYGAWKGNSTKAEQAEEFSPFEKWYNFRFRSRGADTKHMADCEEAFLAGIKAKSSELSALTAHIGELREALESCTTEEGPSQEELNRARAVLASIPLNPLNTLEPHPPHRQCGCKDCTPSIVAIHSAIARKSNDQQ